MNNTLLTVAQVFAIISGVILIFPFGIFIIPLVLAFFNFKAAAVFGKAKRGEATKEQVTNYSIYLIFTSTIGGILGLIAANDAQTSQTGVLNSVEQKLNEIDKLFDRGIISREEYETRRRRILDSM